MVTTLAVLIEEFLLDGRARRLAPKTLSSYAANLGYFLEWLAPEALPDVLASFTLANGRRSSRALAHRTARRATFVAAGGPRGVHALVASDEARKPTTAVGSLRPPIGSHAFAIVLTYFGTRLRATELTGLLLDDVGLAEGYLRVRQGREARCARSACRRRSPPPSSATASTTGPRATTRISS
jgi:hypothetical protein